MKKALKYKEIVERKEKSSRQFYRMEEVFQTFLLVKPLSNNKRKKKSQLLTSR
jgi:hypothetical protein